MSNISSDLEEYIQDYIESYLIPLARSVLSLLPGIRNKKNTIVLSSSGTSVTVIPEETNYVLQMYKSQSIFRKIVTFLNTVHEHPDPRTKYIVQGNAVTEGIIKYKKLHPLNAFASDISSSSSKLIKSNYRQIEQDIKNAIAYLHSIKVRHGDTRIDNIGYDLESNVFVLFDYDKISLTLTRAGAEDDNEIFKESLDRFK